MNALTFMRVDELAKLLTISPSIYKPKLFNSLEIPSDVTTLAADIMSTYQHCNNFEETLEQLLNIAVVHNLLYKCSIPKKDYLKSQLQLYLTFMQNSFKVEHCNRYSRDEYNGVKVITIKKLEKNVKLNFVGGIRTQISALEEAALDSQNLNFSVMYTNKKKDLVLLLGPVALINHDCKANCIYITVNKSVVAIMTLKDIAAGEELLCYYGKHYFGQNNENCECRTCQKYGNGAFSNGQLLQATERNTSIVEIRNDSAACTEFEDYKSKKTFQNVDISGDEYLKKEFNIHKEIKICLKPIIISNLEDFLKNMICEKHELLNDDLVVDALNKKLSASLGECIFLQRVAAKLIVSVFMKMKSNMSLLDELKYLDEQSANKIYRKEKDRVFEMILENMNFLHDLLSNINIIHIPDVGKFLLGYLVDEKQALESLSMLTYLLCYLNDNGINIPSVINLNTYLIENICSPMTNLNNQSKYTDIEGKFQQSLLSGSLANSKEIKELNDVENREVQNIDEASEINNNDSETTSEISTHGPVEAELTTKRGKVLNKMYEAINDFPCVDAENIQITEFEDKSSLISHLISNENILLNSSEEDICKLLKKINVSVDEYSTLQKIAGKIIFNSFIKIKNIYLKYKNLSEFHEDETKIMDKYCGEQVSFLCQFFTKIGELSIKQINKCLEELFNDDKDRFYFFIILCTIKLQAENKQISISSLDYLIKYYYSLESINKDNLNSYECSLYDAFTINQDQTDELEKGEEENNNDKGKDKKAENNNEEAKDNEDNHKEEGNIKEDENDKKEGNGEDENDKAEGNDAVNINSVLPNEPPEKKRRVTRSKKEKEKGEKDDVEEKVDSGRIAKPRKRKGKKKNNNQETNFKEKNGDKEENEVNGTARKNCCCFCMQLFSKLSKHLKTHTEHLEVNDLLEYCKHNDPRKMSLFEELRCRGNILWNNDTELNKGQLIYVRKPREGRDELSVEKVPCEYCSGLFSRKTLSRHYPNCRKKVD